MLQKSIPWLVKEQGNLLETGVEMVHWIVGHSVDLCIDYTWICHLRLQTLSRKGQYIDIKMVRKLWKCGDL